MTLAADEDVDLADVRSRAGCLAARVRGGELRALFTGDGAEAARQVAAACCTSGRAEVRARPVGLEELFIELVRGQEARR